MFMGANPWAIIKPRVKAPSVPSARKILNRPTIKARHVMRDSLLPPHPFAPPRGLSALGTQPDPP